MMQYPVMENCSLKLAVIGVGGGAIRALNRMIELPFADRMNFIAVDTDVQGLAGTHALQIPLDSGLTGEGGTQGDIHAGRQAALASVETIKAAIRDADMVIVIACMGGGTGSGAAPVIAQAAKELGGLTVSLVTKPLVHEGKKRVQNTQESIAAMLGLPVSLMLIPCNGVLYPSVRGKIDCRFGMVDEAICTAVRSITDPLLCKGRIGYDFADHRAVMSIPGIAAMGFGRAFGPSCGRDAAMQAIFSPFWGDYSISDAQGGVVHIAIGRDVGFEEVSEAMSLIRERYRKNIDFFFTCCPDVSADDVIRLSMVATGIQPVDGR